MPQGQYSFRKFNKRRRQEYIQAIRDGKYRSTAAICAGVSYDMVCKYRAAYPEFEMEETEAELIAAGEVENALYKSALKGNVVAMQVYLYNRRPDRWKDQRRINFSLSEEEVNRAIEQQLAGLANGSQARLVSPIREGEETSDADRFDRLLEGPS